MECGGRYVDIEAVDTSELSRVVTTLARPEAPAPWAVKVAAGLRDAVAVVGAGELARWNDQIEYSDAAAAAEVAERCGRLLSPIALFDLTIVRGDRVSFAARVSRLVLDVVALLGAVNRRFVPVDDPKWMPWHLAQLSDQPAGFDDIAPRALQAPTAEAMRDLHGVIEETLDLVDAAVPGADTRTARYAITLRARPTD